MLVEVRGVHFDCRKACCQVLEVRGLRFDY